MHAIPASFRPALLATAATLLLVPAARGQDPMMHMGHGMGTPGGWRMVPMDPNMPMLPGIENLLPTVRPFLPGVGMDPSMLPEARPGESYFGNGKRRSCPSRVT